jgi:hypothetical protein
MTGEEEEILGYLRSQPKVYYSIREVSRFICGRRRYCGRELEWAAPFLKDLLGKDLVEANSMNHYRYKSSNSKAKGKMNVAPSILRILERSGKDFSWVTS